LPEHTIHALTATRQKAAGKVRLFVDFAERALASISGDSDSVSGRPIE
jgi:hypothetical protein